jgi:hypothetical protein
MERDDEHKKWVWKRPPESERDDKDADGRATARDDEDPADLADDELSDEVSPLVSLWRNALEAMRDAATRMNALKQHDEEEAEALRTTWHSSTLNSNKRVLS